MKLNNIFKEAVSGYPWSYDVSPETLRVEFELAGNKFVEAHSRRTKCAWDVALILADIVERGLYRSFFDTYVTLSELHLSTQGNLDGTSYAPVGGVRSAGNPAVLLTWCKENFGISRTQVYSMLEVVDEFTTYDPDKAPGERYLLNAEARDFTFGQLIEMVPIPFGDRCKIQPNWTREMIRAYKKELEERKEGRASAVEIESIKPEVAERYQKYAKFSKKDLIDLVCSLEDVIEGQKVKLAEFEELCSS